MNPNLDKIAQDLYGKIRTRFRDIRMGDENANVLSKKEDIPNARFFEFEYEEGGEPLGTIAITLDPQDGVVLQVSGDLVDDDSRTHHGAYKFIRGFRQFAKDRLLNFDVQNIGKSNLDKRDYEFQAKRKEEPVMQTQPVMENKLYGNNRMSYQDLGEARLIIKHSRPINVDLPAGRTMHIEGIYIENAAGERFKYPAKHINGARALAEHIKHGGNPYDAIGKYITGLSEELASLRKFKGYVSRQAQLSEAMSAVTDRVIERIEDIKKEVQSLQRTSYYETFAESFEAQDEVIIPEDIQNSLIDRLTVRTFNEELKAVFPYIYKFVDESELPVVELGVDDILGEESEDYCDACDRPAKDCACDDHDHETKESFDPAAQFESFLDSLVSENKNELLSPNSNAQAAAIQKLNQLIAQDTIIGPNGNNAIMSLKGLIDDPELVSTLQVLPAETKLNPIIQGYLETSHEDILAKLNFDTQAPTTTAMAEPAAEPQAEPADNTAMAEPEEPAAEPVAEGKKEEDPPFDPDPKPSKKVTPGKYGQGHSQARHLARQGLADVIKKAKKAGATLETQLDFGSRVMTIAEICDECGMSPQDVGFEQPEEQGLPAMLKYISGFYNKDQGNFPLGGTRVKIKVKKAFEDGEFGDAGEEDLIKVLKFIDMKDPSGRGEAEVQEYVDVGAPLDFDSTALETQLQGIKLNFNENDELSRLVALAKGK